MQKPKHLALIFLFGSLIAAAQAQEDTRPAGTLPDKPFMTINGALNSNGDKSAYLDHVPAGSKTPQRIIDFPGRDVPHFLTTSLPKSKNLDLHSTAGLQEAAFSVLTKLAAEMQIKSPEKEFVATKSITDNLGYGHVRLQQYYQGLPVYGSEVVVHIRSGEEARMNGNYYPTPSNIQTLASISSESAGALAGSDLQQLTEVRDLSLQEKDILKYSGPGKELVIFPSRKQDGGYTLAWHLTIRPNFLERWEYFIDAATGSILFKYNNTCADGPKITTATDLNGNTRTLNTYLYSGNYYLLDATKYMYSTSKSVLPDYPVGGIRTLDAGNTDLYNLSYIFSASNSFSNKTAVSTHYNAGIVYDYYYSTFTRNGLDNHGTTMTSVINVTSNGSAMDNAYWNGSIMAYGNGKVLFKPLSGALDVSAHEMTHGVIENEANLEYYGQSGAMNESLADVFGVLVDRDDWKIGEDIVNNANYYPNGALRDMANPHNGGLGIGDASWQPANMSEYYETEDDNGGVHINSGIPNRAFYLIANGIGKDKAEKIYYRAMTQYLTRSSQFIDLRLDVIESAKDLYGDTSSYIKTIENSFDAVQIYDGKGAPRIKDLPIATGKDWILIHNTSKADANTLYLVKPIEGVTKADYHVISKTKCLNKPSITDDGKKAMFIGTDRRIYELYMDSIRPYQTYYNSPTKWRNVAISKDSTKMALVADGIDTSIYVYDFITKKMIRYRLYNPTYSQGITGAPLYASSLEWDYSGQYVMYDAYNRVKSAGGADIEYMDIGFLQVWDTVNNTWGSGKVTKLYNSMPDGISLAHPSYSKNSPGIIAFDMLDVNAGTIHQTVANIETGNQGIIFNNGIWGYPSFSRYDDKLAFTALAANNDTVTASIKLDSTKMAPGDTTAYILTHSSKWPVWFTRGNRKGIFADFGMNLNVYCQDAPVTITNFSDGDISTYSWNFGPNASTASATTAGPFKITYSQPGTVTVKLTVSGAKGSSSRERFFYVAPKATIKIVKNSNKLYCSGGVVKQWYLNGNPIPGATNSNYQPTASGSYTVTAVNSYGCFGESDAFEFTGIEGQAVKGFSYNVAPNPGNGTFHLQMNIAAPAKASIYVTNLLGQHVYSNNASLSAGDNSLPLQLDALPQGVYLMTLDVNGQQFTQKIILQK